MTSPSITIAREALLPALGLAVRAADRRNTIPILGNVLLRAGGETLTIIGTDLDAQIGVDAACNADTPVEITLPAANLHDIVRKLPEGADVRMQGDGGFWTVSAGRSRFRLPALPANDFPLFAAPEFTHAIDIEAKALRAALDTVRFAISTEETRYYLNGIYFHGEPEGALVAVTTDGHRLAQTSLNQAYDLESMPGIILPRRTVELLTKILPDDETQLRWDISAKLVRFTIQQAGGVIVLDSKLIDGTFPDYKRVVPAGNANHFTIDRAALSAAVDRVTTISTARGSAVKFSFGPEDVVLDATNPDSGSAEDTLALTSATGDPVSIGFNGRYCLDLLAATKSDAVRFELGDPGSPALIRPVADDATLFVLMPMRV